MIFKRKPAQAIPDNIESLLDDMQKVNTIVNDATMLSHLIAAENMLANLARKWKLVDRETDPMYQAVTSRILRKRVELKIADDETCDNGFGNARRAWGQ